MLNVKGKRQARQGQGTLNSLSTRVCQIPTVEERGAVDQNVADSIQLYATIFFHKCSLIGIRRYR